MEKQIINKTPRVQITFDNAAPTMGNSETIYQ
jgi:hypothetical protein